MDLMYVAQLLGSFGEFVGAIAVVATLMYLSVQIRQHTRQVASSYTQAMWERTDNRMMIAASNPELAALIAKAQDPRASLTAGEAVQMHSWIASWFGDLEEVYRQHTLGAIDEYAVENRVRNFVPVLQYAQAEASMGYFREVMDQQFMEWFDSRLERLQSIQGLKW